VLSLAPDVLPLDRCPASRWADRMPGDATPAIAFFSREQGDLHTLRALRDGNCHFEAWLRFARAPSVAATNASDLRFGPDPRDNFTTLDFETFRPEPCPEHVPQWKFPRFDLLGP